MIKRFLLLFTSIVLIAAFVFLFNSSNYVIENYIAKRKITELTEKLTKDFVFSLKDNEKELFSVLPCKYTPNKCPNISILKEQYEKSYRNPYIDRALLLSETGVEIFTGRKLDDKYSDLVSAAAAGKNAFITETISTSTDNKKIIIVKKLSDFIGNKAVENKYVLILTNRGKIDFGMYKILWALIVFLPLIFTTSYLNMQSGKIAKMQEKLITENTDFAKQVERLKRENVQQSQFLTNFTHELRTPLNSIIGFSGLIKDQTLGPLGNKEYIKYANDINTSGVHLLSLINDILDYSKSEVGKLKVNVTEADIVKIVKQSLSIVGPRASESKVDLLQSFAHDYYILRIDPKRLKQIILNLLSNSVKFTPEGGNVKVSIYPDIRGEKLSIEVKDTGVGIDEKDIPTVMSLFGQVETDLNRKYEGTGIGLPFAKKLTELMNGTFELQSQVGGGTTIILTFPYDKKLNAEYAELFNKGGMDTV